MTASFADTFFFLALLDRTDQHHQKVAAWVSAESSGRITTTRWVLAETANALAASKYRVAVAEFLAQVESDPWLTIVEPSDVLYHRGLELYSRCSDKAWSLTDCISFVVMEEQAVLNGLTGDHHFAQAGFLPLFASGDAT